MIKKWYVAVLVNCVVFTAAAQEPHRTKVTVGLTSEGQYNMTNDKTNWINLLEVGIETRLSKDLTWNADLISVQNTRLQKGKNGIAEDLQVFSNIEDENRELSLFAFGPVWKINDNLNVFLGIRNVNLDYFTSPLTSVFTGSSQGIFPTVSGNWELLSNYPLSAVALHLEWGFAGNWEIKNSFYNGVASYKMNEVFRFRPGRDGIFNIVQLGYAEPENSGRRLGSYYAGFTCGNAPYEAGGKKHGRYSFYGLLEQSLAGNFGLLLSGGWAPKSEECHAYYGAGIVWSDLFKGNAGFGVLVNRAIYAEGRETGVEINYDMPVCEHISIQPVLHLIRTTGKSNTIGLVRVNISL